MRGPLLAVAAAPVVLLVAAPAHADHPVAPPPPYIDHTQWVQWDGDSSKSLSSLQVFPSAAGRYASTDFASPDEAWSEVLADTPDADTPGMRAQFVCHWQLAESVEPGKRSWNLEPWRPVVDDATMIATGCNPGGPEEPA